MRRVKRFIEFGAAVVLVLCSLTMPRLSADPVPYAWRTVPAGDADGQAQLLAADGNRFVSTNDVTTQSGRLPKLFYFDGNTMRQVPSSNELNYFSVAIEGNYIAHSDTTQPCTVVNGQTFCAAWPTGVHLYDTTTEQDSLLTPDTSLNRGQVALGDGKVAWLQSFDTNRAHPYYNVWLHDIATGTQEQIGFNANSQYVNNGHPVISDGHVYWIAAYRSPSTEQTIASELIDYDITLGTTTQTSVATRSGVFRDTLTGSDGHVLWTDDNNVYLYEGGQVSTIYAGNPGLAALQSKSNLAVWLAVEDGVFVNKLYNIAEGTTQTLASATGYGATTDGRRVGYVHATPDGSQYPAMLDTITGETTVVSYPQGVINTVGVQRSFVVAESFIAWAGYRNNPGHGSQYFQINVAEPQFTPDAPVNVHGLASTVSQRAQLSWDAVDRAGSYKVYRDGSAIATVTSGTSYTDANMGSGTPAYAVSAVNLYGNEGAQTAAVLTYDNDAPVLDDMNWTNNPKSQSQNTTLTVPVTDAGSGVVGGEYTVEDGPQNVAMNWDGTQLSATIGTLSTGVHAVYVRAQDGIGNWSGPAVDYLVVYDGGGYRVAGGRAVLPTLADGDVLPGLSKPNQKNRVKFGMVVKYNNQGNITANSHFTMAYNTGKNCGTPTAQNCHATTLNSTAIQWLASQGNGNSTDIFQGTGTLTVDGTDQQVVFRVRAYDGSLWGGADQFQVMIYSAGANPSTATPLYQVHLKDIVKGDIKISPQTPPPPPA